MKNDLSYKNELEQIRSLNVNNILLNLQYITKLLKCYQM